MFIELNPALDSILNGISDPKKLSVRLLDKEKIVAYKV
jgi:hypothetical protein